MRVSFQRAESWDQAPDDIGIHVYASGVMLTPDAEGCYLSLEDPQPGALYRLRRDGMTVVRDLVAGGREEDNARWWFADELGSGDYQAIVCAPDGGCAVVYVGIGKDCRFWTLDDDPAESIEFQFADVEDYPDIAPLAASFPSTVEA